MTSNESSNNLSKPECVTTNNQDDLGVLPDGWETVPFLKSIRSVRAQVGKINRTDYLRTGNFPIIDQGQNRIAGYWNDIGKVYAGELPVIIFGDHTRIFKYIDFPFIAGADGTQILHPNTEIFDPHFLYLFLTSLHIPSLGYNRHYSLLKEKSIIAPPLAEQLAIASVLRTIQQTKESCERVIAATRRLKERLLQYLFTYGPVPFTQADLVPLKETEIGLIPEHWTSCRISELGRVVTGKTPSTKRPDFWNGNIPFITPVDLEDREISKAERTISEAGLAVIKEIQRGSIAVSCIGNIGKVGLVMIERSATNQQINTIVPRPCHNPTFLFYRLQTMKNQLNSAASITTVPILNKSNFESIKTWLPDLPEQSEIAARLSAVDAKLAAEEARRDALANLFQSLLHHLMTGKVRVTT